MAGLNLRIKLEGIEQIKKWTKRSESLLKLGFEDALYFLQGKSLSILEQHTITGNLARSGIVEVRPATFEGIIEFQAPYASYVQEGTFPHVITPRRKKALRFKIDNTVVFAKKVQHPGFRPIPFLYSYSEFELNLQQATQIIPKYLIKEWEGLS